MKFLLALATGLTLAATPTQTATIQDFILVDAKRDADVRVLAPQDQVVRTSSAPITLRIQPSAGSIGSVRFDVVGPTPLRRIENEAPFALTSNTTKTYEPWNPKPGTYTITAQVFASPNARGTASSTKQITLTVLSAPPAANPSPTPTVRPSPTPAVKPSPSPSLKPSPSPSPAPTPTPSPLPSPTTAPNGSVVISPGTDIQTVVNSKPAGTTYLLKAGIHRLQKIIPKRGDSFIGEKGAILNGSKVLTGFTQEGSVWKITGQTQKAYDTGEHCRAETPRCYLSNELFVNNQRLQHVDALAKVGLGKWFFNYDTDTIYLGDNPTDKLVETSITDHAFLTNGTNHDVTIKNLIIEKYASPGQRGAIYAHINGTQKGMGWVIENNEIRNNHGEGITFSDAARVRFNKITQNGQSGIGGGGKFGLVEGNEVAYNNAAGYDAGWGAGGSKFFRTEGLKVVNNYFHHNDGPGLWTDIDNKNTTYERNIVTHNARMGIQHEISFDATIQYNYLAYNGTTFDTWMWGAQILIQNSSNAIVRNNIVVYGDQNKGDGITIVQQNRGFSNMYPLGSCTTTNQSATCTPWLSLNNVVTGNFIYNLGTAGDNGAAGDFEMEKFLAGKNRFESNQYYFTQPSYTMKWSWPNGGGRTLDVWRTLGFDVAGSLSKVEPFFVPVQPPWNVSVGPQ